MPVDETAGGTFEPLHLALQVRGMECGEGKVGQMRLVRLAGVNHRGPCVF